MEYTEYQVDVLALCNFAEQAQADLARVTAELESSCRDLRVAYEQNASQCVRLNRELALKSDTVEWLNGVTIQRQRAEQAERRNAELVAALRDVADSPNTIISEALYHQIDILLARHRAKQEVSP